MNKKEFVRLIGDLFNYFGKQKMPNDTQMELWFRRVSHIDGEYNINIFNHIVSNCENMPNNIPKAIFEGYFIGNPNKGNLLPATDCVFCKGQGFGAMLSYDETLKRWYSFGVRCGECNVNTWSRSDPLTIPQIIELKGMPLIYRKQETLFYRKFGKSTPPDDAVLSFFWDLTNKAMSKFKKADRVERHMDQGEINVLIQELLNKRRQVA